MLSGADIAVRRGNWKLVLSRPEKPPWAGWSGRFFGSGVETLALFDLSDDVAEAENVASEYPDVVASLTALLQRAREDLGDYNVIGSGARFFDEGPKRPDIWTRLKQPSPKKKQIR